MWLVQFTGGVSQNLFVMKLKILIWQKYRLGLVLQSLKVFCINIYAFKCVAADLTFLSSYLKSILKLSYVLFKPLKLKHFY